VRYFSQILGGDIMGEFIEIRWHGRGGQGAKTAATFLASAAISAGKYGQGFPEYGPERRGAPMRGFTRISDEPITRHDPVESPKVVVVLDPTLLEIVDVTEGMPDDGIILVNTSFPPSTVREKLKLPKGKYKIYTVDATKISIEELGRAIPNTPMLGALIKATGIIDIDEIYRDIKEKFSKKFPEKIVQGNINAIKRAYEELKGEE